jgi:tRNA threonylcarbamoyl adenosine modification protein (Sua5/YciO/YrdC/YwlC family)
MRQITKDELKFEKDIFYNNIQDGSVFIHPTDTIYGIGCNAQHYDAVKKVREIKERLNRPFSVIAPSKEWIREHCIIDERAEKWLNKLPGPYTLILKLKKKDAIAPNVNLDADTIGIRMPNHWIKDIVNELGFPVVTTSANVTKHDYMISLDNLEDKVADSVEFAIYEGEIHGKPSKLVDLTKEEEQIIER